MLVLKENEEKGIHVAEMKQGFLYVVVNDEVGLKPGNIVQRINDMMFCVGSTWWVTDVTDDYCKNVFVRKLKENEELKWI